MTDQLTADLATRAAKALEVSLQLWEADSRLWPTADQVLKPMIVELKQAALTADLIREECAKKCEAVANGLYSTLNNHHGATSARECAAAIRATITDPEAVRRTIEDAERYQWIRSATMGNNSIPDDNWWEKLGNSVDEGFDDLIDAARSAK